MRLRKRYIPEAGPHTKEVVIEVDPRNPYGAIQNPVKTFVPIEERVNREINLTVPEKSMTLKELVGWDQESSDWIKEEKKSEPNHRRNRARNKIARASRKANRG